MAEAIGIAIVVVIWVISSLIKGFKSLLRQTNPTPLEAPPPSQTPFQPQNSFQAQAGRIAPPMTQAQAMQQAVIQQQIATQQARTQPRQPSAGGPAVPTETNRQDFVRQEQELFASEPAGLGVSLSSPAASSEAAPNRLFGGTDGLVRAIILQEVLGPPLSRRNSPSTQAPQHETP